MTETMIFGFLGLFISLLGLGIAGGVAFGSLKSDGKTTKEKLDKLDKDNSTGHKQIFDCQKETDIKMGKVEQHLANLNGSITDSRRRIEKLEDKERDD